MRVKRLVLAQVKGREQKEDKFQNHKLSKGRQWGFDCAAQKQFRKPVCELQRMTKIVTLLNIIFFSHLWER